MKKSILICFLLVSTIVFADCEERSEAFTFIDPTDGKDFSAGLKFYRPASSIRTPVVFILPPIVGETVLDRTMAQRLCAQGVSAYIVNVVKVLPREEEVSNLMVHDNSYIRALAGVRDLIQELKKDAKLSGQFGILGTSLGGMLAAFIAGSEPQISASVIIVGGGNVPGILANSDQEIIKAQRDERMKLFGLKTINDYEDLLRSHIPNDPIHVVQNVTPGSMYLFIALGDQTVPTKYQQELRRQVPSPYVYEMYGNHVTGIIKASTLHSNKILNFFTKKFLK